MKVVDQHAGCGGLWVTWGIDPGARIRGMRRPALSPGLAARPRWEAASATMMSVWEAIPRTQVFDPEKEICSKCGRGRAQGVTTAGLHISVTKEQVTALQNRRRQAASRKHRAARRSRT